MKKKLEWLRKHGGDEAAETFSHIITKMENFAIAAELPSKENDEMGNLLMDEETTEQHVIETEIIETESAKVEDVTKEAEGAEEITEPTAEAVDSDESETSEFVTLKAFEEGISQVIENAIAPLADSLTQQIQLVKNLSAEIENIRTMVDNFSELTKAAEGVDNVLDVIPSAAAMTHIQSKLTNAMKQFSTLSLADDELIKSKPEEKLDETKNEFSLFLSGQ